MLSITSQEWSDLLANPLAIAFLVYLLIGFVISWVITARGMKWRRPPTSGLLWEKKDHARNVLFLFQGAAFMSTIGFFIWIALWPFLLLYLWASQEDHER
jgi:hypothetical protein